MILYLECCIIIADLLVIYGCARMLTALVCCTQGCGVHFWAAEAIIRDLHSIRQRVRVDEIFGGLTRSWRLREMRGNACGTCARRQASSASHRNDERQSDATATGS
jgi:hypothetical protein